MRTGRRTGSAPFIAALIFGVLIMGFFDGPDPAPAEPTFDEIAQEVDTGICDLRLILDDVIAAFNGPMPVELVEAFIWCEKYGPAPCLSDWGE